MRQDEFRYSEGIRERLVRERDAGGVEFGLVVYQTAESDCGDESVFLHSCAECSGDRITCEQ